MLRGHYVCISTGSRTKQPRSRSSTGARALPYSPIGFLSIDELCQLDVHRIVRRWKGRITRLLYGQ